MSLIPTDILNIAPAVPAPIVVAGLGDDSVLAASVALSVDYPVTIPGLVRPMLPHQAAAFVAAQASIARWGTVLLGDDMGLGKTGVMVALIAEHATPGHPALVVAPPVTRHGWITELRAMFPAMTIGFLNGRTRGDVPEADILFINDDPQTMEAWLTDVEVVEKNGKPVKIHVASAVAKLASIVVRDEIHRDKGNGPKPGTRTKVMLAIGEHVRAAGKVIVGATGTLLTNRPVESFLPLQVLGGEELVKALTPGAQKMSAYLYRYCGASQSRFGTDFTGVNMDHIGELHDNLRRTVYVRREKADLGDALPHAGWIVLPLALQGEAMRRYTRLEKDFLALMEEEHGPAAAWRASRAESIVKMMKLWEEAGNAKAAAAVEYVADLVADGNQVVCFYSHTAVHDALEKGFAKAGITTCSINGQVTGDARIDNIEAFQGGEHNVVLAQVKAAGMGVTLTAAAHAVFVQTGWSAGDLKQCADRIYRCDDITRARAAAGEAVTWHVLQAAHANGDPSFDMAMWAVLEKKAKVCDMVNAGMDVTMPDEAVMKMAMEAWYNSATTRQYKLGL